MHILRVDFVLYSFLERTGILGIYLVDFHVSEQFSLVSGCAKENAKAKFLLDALAIIITQSHIVWKQRRENTTMWENVRLSYNDWRSIKEKFSFYDTHLFAMPISHSLLFSLNESYVTQWNTAEIIVKCYAVLYLTKKRI